MSYLLTPIAMFSSASRKNTLSVTVKTCFFSHDYFKNLSEKGKFQLWQTLTLHFVQTDVCLCCILGISIPALLLNSVNFFQL